MGHKVNPYGFRLGVIYPWKSNWYADRDYSEQLHEDIWIRKHIRKRLSRAGISSIDIERKGDQIWVSANGFTKYVVYIWKGRRCYENFRTQD